MLRVIFKNFHSSAKMSSKLHLSCRSILNFYTREISRNSKAVSFTCSSCVSNRTSSTYLSHLRNDQPLFFTKNHLINIVQICEKSSWRNPDKKGRKSSEYESDSDSDDEFVRREKAKTEGVKVVQVQIDNLRVDAVIKHAFGIARNKSEVLFYENKIRINGKKPTKKSADTSPGDEVDVVKGISHENKNFIVVSRAEILRVRPSGDYLVMTLRKQKNLTIENYDEDPWIEKASENSEDEQNKELA